jgi:glucosyl-dolichyl phosphate glucuronosyltransferase
LSEEDQVKASVIVPTFGQRPGYLLDALVSVLHQKFPRKDYEVVVVDNSPNGAALPIVEQARTQTGNEIRYVQEPQLGLLYARHAGAKAAHGDVLVFIDDDVITQPEWLGALVEAFKNPDVACTGGKALPQWEKTPPDWYDQFEPGYLSLLDLGEETLDLKYPVCVWGCNMAVRKSALFETGGFNPDGIGDRKRIWFRGDGECGLQEKITNSGLRIIYEPDAWLIHRIPASRLTPEHFYWRFFIQGIQESFVEARRIQNRRFFALRLIGGAFYSLYRAARNFVGSAVHPDHRIRSLAEAWSWYGKAQHQLRTAVSPSLRKHVLRPSYL